MADGVVQVAPDSTGKKIDTAELTRSDGTVVERQRVVIGDDTDASALADLTNLPPPPSAGANGLYGVSTWVLPQPLDQVARRQAEVAALATIQNDMNQNLSRGRERGFSFDRRGGSTRGR